MIAALIGIVLSWLVRFIHNIAELPDQTLTSPESLYPTLVSVGLLALWFTNKKRVAAWLLLVWGLLHFIGGDVLSVLPLRVLLFAVTSRSRTTSSTCFTACCNCLSSPPLRGGSDHNGRLREQSNTRRKWATLQLERRNP